MIVEMTSTDLSEMSVQAREAAKPYDWSIVAQQYLDVYQSVLDRTTS